MGKRIEQTLHNSRNINGKYVNKRSPALVIWERRPKPSTRCHQPAAATMRQTTPKAGEDCKTHNHFGELAVSSRSILHLSYKRFHSSIFMQKKRKCGTSLAVQWLKTHLPMEGTWVRFLVQEDSTCCRATKPVPEVEPVCCNY